MIAKRLRGAHWRKGIWGGAGDMRIPEISEEGGFGPGLKAGRVRVREWGRGVLGEGRCMGVSLGNLTPEA